MSCANPSTQKASFSPLIPISMCGPCAIHRCALHPDDLPRSGSLVECRPPVKTLPPTSQLNRGERARSFVHATFVRARHVHERSCTSRVVHTGRPSRGPLFPTPSSLGIAKFSAFPQINSAPAGFASKHPYLFYFRDSRNHRTRSMRQRDGSTTAASTEKNVIKHESGNGRERA